MVELRRATYVLLGGFLLHNVDHARRGIDAITDHVVWAGTIAAVLIAVIATLVFTEHPLAPSAAAAGGIGLAAGVAATHLFGDWGVLSDSLLNLGFASWIAVLAEITGLLLVGIAGLREFARQPPPDGSRTPFS